MSDSLNRKLASVFGDEKVTVPLWMAGHVYVLARSLSKMGVVSWSADSDDPIATRLPASLEPPAVPNLKAYFGDKTITVRVGRIAAAYLIVFDALSGRGWSPSEGDPMLGPLAAKGFIQYVPPGAGGTA